MMVQEEDLFRFKIKELLLIGYMELNLIQLLELYLSAHTQRFLEAIYIQHA